MGKQDDVRSERLRQKARQLEEEIEACHVKALKALGEVSYLRKVFDGRGGPVFIYPEKPVLLKSGNDAVPEEILKQIALGGTDVALDIGGYKVEIAVCPKNVVVGLFDGGKPMASVVVTPKKKSTAAKKAVFGSAGLSGIYRAICEVFSAWTSVPMEYKHANRIAPDGFKNMVYVNALFQAFYDLPLEGRIERISERLAISNVTVCWYLTDAGVEFTGLHKLNRRYNAENSRVAEFWEAHKEVHELEARVRLASEDAGISPMTACGYLRELKLPEKTKSELYSLRNALNAENSRVAVFWEEYKAVPDVGERVRLVAKASGLDPVTVCHYLRGCDIPDKDKLAKEYLAIQAKKSNVLLFWDKYKDVPDLETRVRMVSEAIGIGFVTVCMRLRVSNVPEKKEIRALAERYIRKNRCAKQ